MGGSWPSTYSQRSEDTIAGVIGQTATNDAPSRDGEQHLGGEWPGKVRQEARHFIRRTVKNKNHVPHHQGGPFRCGPEKSAAVLTDTTECQAGGGHHCTQGAAGAGSEPERLGEVCGDTPRYQSRIAATSLQTDK